MEKELTASKRSKSSDTSAIPVQSDDINLAEEILRHVSVGVQTDACLTADASTQTSAFEISTFVCNNGTFTPVGPSVPTRPIFFSDSAICRSKGKIIFGNMVNVALKALNKLVEI